MSVEEELKNFIDFRSVQIGRITPEGLQAAFKESCGDDAPLISVFVHPGPYSAAGGMLSFLRKTEPDTIILLEPELSFVREVESYAAAKFSKKDHANDFLTKVEEQTSPVLDVSDEVEPIEDWESETPFKKRKREPVEVFLVVSDGGLDQFR
eukprot:Trichotokara_eunicae@DN9975_c0_g1_i1.p1